MDPYYDSPFAYRYTYIYPEGTEVIPRPAREVGRAYVKLTKEQLTVKLDVHQYAPEEVFVSSDPEAFLVVQAVHQENVDRDGIVSRSFKRRFPLPEDADLPKLDSEINSEGELTVHVPRKKAMEGAGVVHKITHALGSMFHVPGHHYEGSVVPDPYECHAGGVEPTGVQLSKEHLTIKVELPQFSVEEVVVKVVDDKVVISGEHKEKEEENPDFSTSYTSRSFTRQYFLPINADTDKLICEMDERGLLTVIVPRVQSAGGKNEKIFVPVKV